MNGGRKIPVSAVHAEQRATGRLQRPTKIQCVCERKLGRRQKSNFARHWDRQPVGESAYNVDKSLGPPFQQKRAIVAPLRYFLRTPQIDVDGVTVVLHQQRGLEQRLWVVATELGDQGSVLGAGAEGL